MSDETPRPRSAVWMMGCMVLIAWVLGGVLALLGALTLAELAAMYPRSGGVFAYIEEGLGPMPAFLFGFDAVERLPK